MAEACTKITVLIGQDFETDSEFSGHKSEDLKGVQFLTQTNYISPFVCC